jgi:ferredoxin
MRLKTLLSTYRDAGGADACLLLHNPESGRDLVQAIGRHAVRGGKGLPARVIPFEVFHIASVGMDVLLGALCYGASQVVLAASAESEPYVAALREQIAIAESILHALGFQGVHFDVFQAMEAKELESALWSLIPAATVAKPATFNLSAEKRTTLDFEIDHLAKEGANQLEQIELPAGAPFGSLSINKSTCTLCKACIGACPEAALLDSADAPRLRFIERNCVQCGLCASTCPEDAITLVPRLLLTQQAKEPVTLNEAEPFDCVRCGKPFGTRKMVDAMLGKLGAHSMFSGAGALRRLQMCGDCRVVDMMENRTEASIFDVKK